jgi:hypothetical protein
MYTDDPSRFEKGCKIIFLVDLKLCKHQIFFNFLILAEVLMVAAHFQLTFLTKTDYIQKHSIFW